MNRNIVMSGVLEQTLTGPDGKVKAHDVVTNLIVSAGRNHVVDQLSDQAQAAMSHMAIGTGTTTAALTDTALGTEAHRNALTSTVAGTGTENNKVTYTADFAAGEGTGTITEAGIFNSSSAGTMLCRTVFAAKEKAAGDTLRQVWTITISS